MAERHYISTHASSVAAQSEIYADTENGHKTRTAAALLNAGSTFVSTFAALPFLGPGSTLTHVLISVLPVT